jgi:hypothetical protein
MEKNEKDLTPEQSLQLIESMINKAKDNFGEDGHLYILWGWLVLTASIAEFILYHFFHYQQHYIVWNVSWPLLIYQSYYLAKKRTRQRVRTYTASIIGYVWLTFLILSLLIGFLIGRLSGGGDYFQHIFPLVLALYGMPVFLSGVVIRFRPLVTGGLCCWVLSLAATFLPYDYQMLALSAAMLTAWLIPGYLLRAKYRKEYFYRQ